MPFITYLLLLIERSISAWHITNLFLLVLHTNNGHPLVSEELNRADHGQWTRFTCTPVILSSTLRVCGSFLATYKKPTRSFNLTFDHVTRVTAPCFLRVVKATSVRVRLRLGLRVTSSQNPHRSDI